MTEILVNADDFGISKGVNEAVISMHKAGNLNSASLMVNAKYAIDAKEKALLHPSLKVGLHFNLTTGKSVLHSISLPLLVDENGIFKNGFVKLLLLSFFKRKQFLSEVEAEMKAQIALIKHYKIKLYHIDGHRHIHYLPGVFKIAQKVASEEGGLRIRIINESLFKTLKLRAFPPISGIIKWFILRFLGFVNGACKASKTEPKSYFFSIIHSCRITNELIEKMNFKEYEKVEIMLHPSFRSLDDKEVQEYEKEHLTSHFRDLESKFIKPKL